MNKEHGARTRGVMQFVVIVGGLSRPEAQLVKNRETISDAVSDAVDIQLYGSRRAGKIRIQRYSASP